MNIHESNCRKTSYNRKIRKILILCYSQNKVQKANTDIFNNENNENNIKPKTNILNFYQNLYLEGRGWNSEQTTAFCFIYFNIAQLHLQYVYKYFIFSNNKNFFKATPFTLFDMYSYKYSNDSFMREMSF